MSSKQRVLSGVALLAAVVAGSVVAYMIVEDLDVLDAIYLVVITLSTVGFSEPGGGLTSAGRIITMVLIFVGITGVVYSASSVLDLVLDAVAGDRRRLQREAKMIEQLSDHVIVCGYGRVGRRVYDILTAEDTVAVIIEVDEDLIEDGREHGVALIEGDAARDEYLEQAGIDRAKTLVACVGGDSDNLAIVLSARARRPDLYILARGGDAESQRKLRLAGADRVVAPEAAGGERLARLAERKELTEFVEISAGDLKFEFQVEELPVAATAPFAGRVLGASDIRSVSGVLVLAIYHADGVISAPPAPSTLIQSGDVLVSLGTEAQLDVLREMAGGKAVRPF